MPFQLEFGEERQLHEICGRQLAQHKSAAAELRRAYDALMELGVTHPTHPEMIDFRDSYLQAFQSFHRGDMQAAELGACAASHLCRAAWFDLKARYLENHADDVPHQPGLSPEGAKGIEHGMLEVESRLARLKLSGRADRTGRKTRQLLDRLAALPDRNSLLADTLMKAAYELCLATEAFRDMETRLAA